MADDDLARPDSGPRTVRNTHPAQRPHPDRLLPTEPRVRDIARGLYAHVRDRPIVSPHGHVDAHLLARDEPFSDPATLFITPDHYVTRMLHAHGVGLDELGVGREALDEASARAVWRRLCEHWPAFRGTPIRYWLDVELAEIFGVEQRLSLQTADETYDAVAARLAEPEFRPRALYRRFGIDALATTDDPCDDLASHAELRDDPSWQGRVLPTFRPDAYLEPAVPDWPQRIKRLGEAADVDTGSYDGYVAALEARRRYFIEHGATATDHGHADLGTEPLQTAEARRIYAAALAGAATEAEATAFRRHMVTEMARMSCDDGLAMALHPGIVRNHHRPTLRRFGPDTGHDLPVRLEVVRALRPLLERYGTHPGFHLILFTVDETVYSREIAPLAGFYPSVYVGAPWWFLDTPDAIRRFRRAVTDSAGFGKTAGFVDDTRAFCSIPARHDLSRRIDAGVLAEFVAEHRPDEEEAAEVLVELVERQPRVAFKLGDVAGAGATT
ncbi:glucuronate isomerase [Phytoactinopolyspora halotolerans]|uniref:Uronate isomerase n=1 Tax=Phytoactinopolyspora halotolerans TaxID=1981512 RepID=A0A6L9SAR0_9ACTN|nr:glucuronate isomerase [Phytoactinopolyspora halotolerans]NEE02346.1 glucuronate isomerase [Phytoactinopolyspora halotolerans]